MTTIDLVFVVLIVGAAVVFLASRFRASPLARQRPTGDVVVGAALSRGLARARRRQNERERERSTEKRVNA